LALDARVHVPGGLAMAHGDDAGDFHVRILGGVPKRGL
jgi:hypothetical protein